MKKLLLGLITLTLINCISPGRENMYNDKQSFNRYLHILQSAENFPIVTEIDSSKYKFLTCVFGGVASLQLVQDKAIYYQVQALHASRNCIKTSLKSDCQLFDSIVWEESPLESLSNNNDHLAYLGYLNVLLSFQRYIELHMNQPENDARPVYTEEYYTNLNNLITKKLLIAYENSISGVLQTYPSQSIMTDNAAALASLAIYYKAYDLPYSDTLLRAIEKFKELGIDKQTGLLNYYIDYKTGKPDGTLRGSGTAVAMYFMSFVDSAVSRDLYNSLIYNLSDSKFGLYGIREFIEDKVEDPIISGDTDTGPIVYGLGTTATGFTIAGAKIFRDETTFYKLTKTAWVIGLPVEDFFGSVNFTNTGLFENMAMFLVLTAKK